MWLSNHRRVCHRFRRIFSGFPITFERATDPAAFFYAFTRSRLAVAGVNTAKVAYTIRSSSRSSKSRRSRRSSSSSTKDRKRKGRRTGVVMTSALERTSRVRDRNPNRRTKISTDSYQYPDPGDWAPRRAPAAPFPFDETAAKFPGREDDNNATTVELPSRGVRLLLKAKGFHLAVRGHRETSGFRYISAQPKRQARHRA